MPVPVDGHVALRVAQHPETAIRGGLDRPGLNPRVARSFIPSGDSFSAWRQGPRRAARFASFPASRRYASACASSQAMPAGPSGHRRRARPTPRRAALPRAAISLVTAGAAVRLGGRRARGTRRTNPVAVRPRLDRRSGPVARGPAGRSGRGGSGAGSRPAQLRLSRKPVRVTGRAGSFIARCKRRLRRPGLHRPPPRGPLAPAHRQWADGSVLRANSMAASTSR